MLLADPGAVQNPFYRLVPTWGALSDGRARRDGDDHRLAGGHLGRFLITRQAIQLGYLPRLQVRHTSEEEIGQVYVPQINGALLVAIVLLVLGFQTSDSLGAAYGIAVTGMMVITSGVAFVYMRSIGWSLPLAAGVFGFFLVIDLVFLSANLFKVVEGGWFPIVVAAVAFAVMSTWWRGRGNLAESRAPDTMPLATFLEGQNRLPAADRRHRRHHDARHPPGADRPAPCPQAFQGTARGPW